MSQDDPEENPYRAAAAMGAEPRALTELEVAAYAHEEDSGTSLYYRERFRQAHYSRGVSFNVPAAIFGSIWCCWRKLWLTAFLLYAVEFVAIIALRVALAFGVPVPNTVLLGEPIVLLLLVRVPFGFFANSIYLRAAERAAERLRSAAGEVNLRELAAQGGVSMAGLGLALLLKMALRTLDVVGTQ